MSKWILLAFAGLAILCGYSIYAYGVARYDLGKAECEKAQASEAAKANDSGRKEFEQNQTKARNVPADSIDDEFRKLGLLRS